MLLGRFEEGRVTNTNPELGSGRPDEATVDLRPFDLDMLGSLANGQIKGQGPLSGTRRVQLSEEEVARLASSSALGMDVMGVDLGEEYLTDGSGTEVLGARLPVRMMAGTLDELASYVLSRACWRRSGCGSPGGLRKTCSGERASRIPSSYRLGGLRR